MQVLASGRHYLVLICLFLALTSQAVNASRERHATTNSAAAKRSNSHHHAQQISTASSKRRNRPSKDHANQAAKLAQAANLHSKLAKREAKLAKLVQSKSHAKLSAHAKRIAAIRAAKLAKIAKTESRVKLTGHAKRLAALHAEHLAKLAEAESPVRLSGHEKRLAAVHTAHLAKLAQAHQRADHAQRLAAIQQSEHSHEVRLAKLQTREAAEHAARLNKIAEAEAQRQKHKDKQSNIINLAANSQLPIWQGDAYAAQVPVKLVTVNLNDPRVKVSALLARNGIGTSEPFTQMIDRAHPQVAVTGTFFSLDNLRPVGDIVVNGSLAYFGGMGTALAIRPDNHADMVTVPWGHHHDWTGYDTVVACGPRLLKDRQIVLDPHMEHFKDKHMLSPNSRIAVGITGHNQLVFCMTREPIYLGRLAKIMKSIGCKEAMNLDAGTSTGFYCNGRMMARPGRWLTNAIVVYSNRKPRDYEAQEASAPISPHSATVALASYHHTVN